MTLCGMLVSVLPVPAVPLLPFGNGAASEKVTGCRGRNAVPPGASQEEEIPFSRLVRNYHRDSFNYNRDSFPQHEDSVAQADRRVFDDASGDAFRRDVADGDTVGALRPRRTLFRKVVDYFRLSDSTARNKRFDFGVLPGPHYSSTAGLGLGVVGTGLYSMDRSDPSLPKSNVAVYADMTTKGFLMIGVKGNNVFPKDKYRLDYRFYVYTFPTNFWGIGFGNGDEDGNETDYRRIRFDAMARFMFRVAPNFYLGPLINYQFVQARDVEDAGLPLFAGQDLTLHAQTAGVSFTYDTRDFMLNAYRGWFLQLDQTFTPRFMGNDYCFSTTDLTVCTYRQVWRGGVLAGEWHSRFNYGNPAWCMMSEAGSTSRLRGYFEGRYRDKNIVEAQVELRQHLWKRNGMVVWAGAGEVFPEARALRWRKLLPNAGIGYRWEFKRRVNVRVDYGFTRNGGGFMFNINEAF